MFEDLSVEFGSGKQDDLSVEIGDFDVQQVNKFDRIFRVSSGGSFSQSPLVYNGIVYVGCMDRHVYAIDAKTGEQKWSFETNDGIFLSSAVISEGIIYIGSYDFNLYALNADTGELIWKFMTRDKVMVCAYICEERIYFGSNDYNIYCLNKRNGQLLWRFKTQGEVASTPCVYKGKLYFGSYDRFLYCLDAINGNLIWKFETQGNVFNTPPILVHEGRVYFPSFDNYLRVVDAETGKLIWKFLTGQYGGCGAPPILHNGILYQQNREGMIHALTLDGSLIWTFRINHTMGIPRIHDDLIYTVCGDQFMRCIDLNGREVWRFQTQDEVWWRPTIWEDRVFFTSMDCNLYCVNINTHELEWKFKSKGSPSNWPPPFETHELKVPVRQEEVLEDKKKSYDLLLNDDGEETIDTYKSRITYQMSTQYASKGKYQVDSDEEAL